MCITWTHLPGITWVLPIIGHTGIAGTNGEIHDFAGPYYISIDDFAFGSTVKYLRLDIDPADYERFNRCLKEADKTYKGRMHNICCDNCHSHVARALNNFKYRGRDDYTMVSIAWMLVWESKYVSWCAVIQTYFVFAIILGFVLVSWLGGK